MREDAVVMRINPGFIGILYVFVVSLLTVACAVPEATDSLPPPDQKGANSPSLVPQTDPEILKPGLRWNTIRSKIFEKHCTECHSPPKPEKNFDITSIAQVRAKAALVFERAVILKNMPLLPVDPLSADEKRALSNWIVDEMPE